MLSNVELKELLLADDPLIKGVAVGRIGEKDISPLQPASVDLHIGKILVPPEPGGGRKDILSLGERYAIPIGGTVVVFSKEEMNFTNDYCGLLLPKSSGMGERGILVTNASHVEPGYKGTLRFTIVNLSSANYEIRVGDPVSAMCVFRLTVSANPGWQQMHATPGKHTQDFVLSLSQKMLSIDQIAGEARRAALRAISETGLWVTCAAVIIGIVSSAITVGLCWAQFIEPRIERLEQKEAHANDPMLPPRAPAEGASAPRK